MKVKTSPFIRIVACQQAGCGSVVQELATLLEKIAEMVADFSPDM